MIVAFESYRAGPHFLALRLTQQNGVGQQRHVADQSVLAKTEVCRNRAQCLEAQCVVTQKIGEVEVVFGFPAAKLFEVRCVGWRYRTDPKSRKFSETCHC